MSEEKKENPIVLEGVTEFPKENKGGPIYSEESFNKSIKSINPDKSMEEAVQEAAINEMSAEEQQEILKQIIRESKRSAMNGLKKSKKNMVSPNLLKNRKAKLKMQKKSRKINRKKKK